MSIDEHTHPPYMKIWGVLAVLMLGKVLSTPTPRT